MHRFLELMKQSSMQAYHSSGPADIVTGKVLSVSPLEVRLDAKRTLTEEFLVLTSEVRDYEVDVTFDFSTRAASGGDGYAAFASHSHGIVGTTRITIHNGLKVGDDVIMIKAQGSQKYVVLDKGG